MMHEINTLPNGLRVVFTPNKSAVGHVALHINVGSRDELAHEQGMAHFIEHNLFKGTKKRKAYHILSRLDDVGGELNAYTTKEETVIYASFLQAHLARSLELVGDILCNSTFPERELQKEKEVIRDEIEAYADSPAEQIFDDFENVIFANHPMGRSILGTSESLATFSRVGIHSFLARNYHPEAMVLSISGQYSASKVALLVGQYFTNIPFRATAKQRQAVEVVSPKSIEYQKDIQQSHAILGNSAYGMHQPEYAAFFLLNNLLGGPGMNSRLNLNIREKYGFAYNIESFFSAYTDCGAFGVYVGTNKGSMARSLALIKRELKILREKKLGVVQLHKAQQQLIGQLALSQENNLAQTLAIGRSLLHHNRIDTLAEINQKILSTSSADIQAVANHVFNPEKLSLLVFSAK